MEYIDYDNISTYLKKNGLDSINAKNCGICDKIEHGINLLFKHGIYHNDLNGENLLVNGEINNPDIYLIDFGNATPYKIYPLQSNTYIANINKLKGWFNMKPRTGGKSKKHNKKNNKTRNKRRYKKV
jgi:serine/threonine protein kinase